MSVFFQVYKHRIFKLEGGSEVKITARLVSGCTSAHVTNFTWVLVSASCDVCCAIHPGALPVGWILADRRCRHPTLTAVH